MPTHTVTTELLNIQGKGGEKMMRTCVSFSSLLDTKRTKGFIFTYRISQSQAKSLNKYKTADVVAALWTC